MQGSTVDNLLSCYAVTETLPMSDPSTAVTIPRRDPPPQDQEGTAGREAPEPAQQAGAGGPEHLPRPQRPGAAGDPAADRDEAGQVSVDSVWTHKPSRQQSSHLPQNILLFSVAPSVVFLSGSFLLRHCASIRAQSTAHAIFFLHIFLFYKGLLYISKSLFDQSPQKGVEQIRSRFMAQLCCLMLPSQQVQWR